MDEGSEPGSKRRRVRVVRPSEGARISALWLENGESRPYYGLVRPRARYPRHTASPHSSHPPLQVLCECAAECWGFNLWSDHVQSRRVHGAYTDRHWLVAWDQTGEESCEPVAENDGSLRIVGTSGGTITRLMGRSQSLTPARLAPPPCYTATPTESTRLDATRIMRRLAAVDGSVYQRLVDSTARAAAAEGGCSKCRKGRGICVRRGAIYHLPTRSETTETTEHAPLPSIPSFSSTAASSAAAAASSAAASSAAAAASSPSAAASSSYSPALHARSASSVSSPERLGMPTAPPATTSHRAAAPIVTAESGCPKCRRGRGVCAHQGAPDHLPLPPAAPDDAVVSTYRALGGTNFGSDSRDNEGRLSPRWYHFHEAASAAAEVLTADGRFVDGIRKVATGTGYKEAFKIDKAYCDSRLHSKFPALDRLLLRVTKAAMVRRACSRSISPRSHQLPPRYHLATSHGRSSQARTTRGEASGPRK